MKNRILISLIISLLFGKLLKAQGDIDSSFLEKFRRISIDSMYRETYWFLQSDFDGINLKEAKVVFDSLPIQNDNLIVWQKRTMNIVELRTMPYGFSDHGIDFYNVYNNAENWKHEDINQFDELPYFPADTQITPLYEAICNQVMAGKLKAFNKSGKKPYSIEEFRNGEFYRKRVQIDTANIGWQAIRFEDIIPIQKLPVYRYIVIEDWVCYSDMRFESKAIAIAPLKREYEDFNPQFHCFYDQLLLFWIFFK
ncbi:MAG TPA: hypothetical protein DHV29_04060 [Bacteroidales bacterium]|nr:MAG: hypothetical protein A2W94_15785 [Bacteroidetes bacterium GWE2_42_42]HCB61756.1 hypothetical protein [Bacteroidales bacterium]HCY22648.1 hypothetical protein [Bacteroidales bacterium]